MVSHSNLLLYLIHYRGEFMPINGTKDSVLIEVTKENQIMFIN